MGEQIWGLASKLTLIDANEFNVQFQKTPEFQAG